MEILLQSICILTLFFVISGFICYKSGHTDTWENGIQKVFMAIYNFVYEGATGKVPPNPNKEIDVRLYLSSDEMLGLTKALDIIYEQLYLNNGIIYTEDIAWFDYSAFGLTSKYQTLSLDDRKRLIVSIITKYYQEIHGTISIPIYVKICSEYRLYFAIALNQEGKAYLDKQEQLYSTNLEEFKTEYSSKVIEEHIGEDLDYEVRL